MKFNKYFTGFAACAFLGVVSFFQVDSYFADKHNLNWLFIAIGVALAGLAYHFIKKV
jgi:uncharacterized membrane protein